MANIITSFRIICSIALIFFSIPSFGFYFVYIVGGLSDIIDGIVARKTDSTSKFVSKLDTIADFVFIAICMFKIIFYYPITQWVMIWISIIAVIKIINIVSGFVIERQIVAKHTILNKITGLLMFLLPLTLSYITIKYSAGVVCLIATLAAIQEGHYFRCRKEI